MNEEHDFTDRGLGTPDSPAVPPEVHAQPGPNSVERILETVQTVLTALILAFIFRAFFVEQFVIPTGSMADALLGAHATQTCPACGYEYSYAPLRETNYAARGFIAPRDIVCPNCLLTLIPDPADIRPRSGDRILVNKWPCALAGLLPPQRWDVIVFRDPTDPDQHYIKRLVGLPGETIEIVDGDLFINGHIARKTPAAQRCLWFPVFDQAYMPIHTAVSGRLPRWMPVDPPAADGHGWSGAETRVLRYDALDNEPRGISFRPDTGREYLMDFYAYDRRSSGVYVGDVRLMGEVTLRAGDGLLRWELTHAADRFTVELDAAGHMTLRMVRGEAEPVVLGTGRFDHAIRAGRPFALELAHVDYRVYVALDGREVFASTDANYAPDLEALRAEPIQQPVALRIEAQNLSLELRRLRIERDVYYTRSPGTIRADAGHPFTLRGDEYFVLGDNSPDSHDGREWTYVGAHLPPDTRPGTVREDQIVGQAAFVYLPGLLPKTEFGWRWWVPDVGRMRFVR